jgi:hypothetical protein
MVPAAGGKSLPITTGAGPDMGMAVSSDGKRLIYYVMNRPMDLWLVTGERDKQTKITRGEGRWFDAAMSPDGRRIAVAMSDKDWLNKESRVYVIDVGDKRQNPVATDDSRRYSTRPAWSPDGVRFTFATRTFMQPADSAWIHLADISTMKGSPLGRGFDSHWFDAENVLIFSNRGTEKVSVRTGRHEQYFEDSTMAMPVLGGAKIVYRDFRSGSEGTWIVPQQGGRASGERRQIFKSARQARTIDMAGRKLHFRTGLQEIFTLDLLTNERRSFYKTRDLIATYSVNPDDQSMIVSIEDPEVSIVQVDNLFR